MKVFLIIVFVISLELMSCDAGVLSSQPSVEDDSNTELDPKPINIIGTYQSENGLYHAEVTKDDRESGGYLLRFIDTGIVMNLDRPHCCKYDADKKSFVFDMEGDREVIIYYVLLFEEEGFPMLTVGHDKTFQLHLY